MSMTEQEAKEDTWRTRDLPLAAYLHLKGFRYIEMEQVMQPDAQRIAVYWHFIDSDELRDQIDIFLQGDGQVEPSAYQDSVTYLKREMFNLINRRTT